jgi:hypothetical protein
MHLHAYAHARNKSHFGNQSVMKNRIKVCRSRAMPPSFREDTNSRDLLSFEALSSLKHIWHVSVSDRNYFIYLFKKQIFYLFTISLEFSLYRNRSQKPYLWLSFNDFHIEVQEICYVIFKQSAVILLPVQIILGRIKQVRIQKMFLCILPPKRGWRWGFKVTRQYLPLR